MRVILAMKKLLHRKATSMAAGLLPTSKARLRALPVPGAGNLYLLLTALLLFTGCGSSDDPTQDDDDITPGYTIEATHTEIPIHNAPFLREVSGLAHSLRNDTIIWTHNDSGDDPKIYAISESGNYLGTIALKGVVHHDWEDITAVEDPSTGRKYIYIGDFGDNKSQYTSYNIYRIPEPEPEAYLNRTFEMTPEVVNYEYSDIQTQDAEALFVMPESMEVLILSKVVNNARIYTLGQPFNNTGTHIADRIGTFDLGFVVGADFQKNQLIVKSYASVYCYNLGSDILSTLSSNPVVLPYSLEPRGEGLCWDNDNKGYFTMSELAGGTTPILNYYKILN